ncbi:interferon alpha/beta receptor 1a-like isoform X1 [Scyliorhinus canicula]|uniref:interferon alpha/beta receptor 1a-like isoform X1 n=1 Tax=Scyliorhinus canicula TaxID=7830 RepID=UPI0018F6BC31|nr:interferon alpha/beta receptor 1a-like isoform X1 [Scyliorhinus canicula]
MAAAFRAFLTVVLTVQAFGEIQRPTNLQIRAFNLNYVLKWDDVQRSHDSVSYTVQYKRLFQQAQQVNSTVNLNIHFGNWKDVKGCETISHTECDFTSTDIIFLGQYMLRVRAQRGNQSSAWADSKSFLPYKHNVIGPPSVNVDSRDNLLNVYIMDPQTENNKSIPEAYKEMKYSIIYWKEYSREINVTNSTSKLVSLKLEPWTMYCLRVQLFSPTFRVVGQLSHVVCEKINGATPLWKIVVIFIVSLVIVFSVAVGCSFCIHYAYRCIKYAFFPPHILPEHLQEYFSVPSQNAFLELVPEEDAEKCCDQLKVICETESLNSYSSSLTLPHIGNEKNDQSGQTSTDSGQFSNDGSSKSVDTEEFEGRALRELDLHTKLMYFCE